MGDPQKSSTFFFGIFQFPTIQRAWGYPLVNIQKTMERSTRLLMGKLTISMAMFNSKLLVYQRVNLHFPMVFPLKPPFSYGFPIKTTIFLWFSYGFPMKSPLNWRCPTTTPPLRPAEHPKCRSSCARSTRPEASRRPSKTWGQLGGAAEWRWKFFPPKNVIFS